MAFPLSLIVLQNLTTTVNPNLIKLCLLFPEFTRSSNYLRNTKKMLLKKVIKRGITYYYFGKKHREDGPAVELVDGTKMWYINDKLHRKDGPAMELGDGSKCWYINGEKHRVGGPAMEYSSGDKQWYVNDILHRKDGPAVECVNGTKMWYINGKRKRVFI